MVVIADAYWPAVSTRRIEALVRQVRFEQMSKSQVSRLAESLGRIVAAFRTLPLDGSRYPYFVVGALEVKVPRGRPHREWLRRPKLLTRAPTSAQSFVATICPAAASAAIRVS
jgi:hypothetical protein